MMIRAYQKIYVNGARILLGDLFDYAINCQKIKGDDFIKLFLINKISKLIEEGDANYILGKSGIEVFHEIIEETSDIEYEYCNYKNYNRSIEYWIGWSIGYYQWYSNRTFMEIFNIVPYDYLVELYNKLHEADICKFVDTIENFIINNKTDTNLKRIRMTYGCSQQQLSKISNVSLRSIQMYEQRNKDINKASVETVYKLSKALGCEIEDLIERGIN